MSSPQASDGQGPSEGLRDELVREGLEPGEIEYPEYLPAGEFQMRDPDGYCLMIAQSAPDTP